jgi:hypothetical protein
MKFESKELADTHTDGVEVALNDFVENISVSKNFYFKVGTAGNANDWSPVLSLAVTACGEETLEVSLKPRAINFIYKEGDNV